MKTAKLLMALSLVLTLCGCNSKIIETYSNKSIASMTKGYEISYYGNIALVKCLYFDCYNLTDRNSKNQFYIRSYNAYDILKLALEEIEQNNATIIDVAPVESVTIDNISVPVIYKITLAKQ